MDLHIKDRLLLPSLLPERGSFMEYNLKKAILKKIAISEQDKTIQVFTNSCYSMLCKQ